MSIGRIMSSELDRKQSNKRSSSHRYRNRSGLCIYMLAVYNDIGLVLILLPYDLSHFARHFHGI